MNQQKQNILIVETKDGAKYQGIFVSKDIQKQILTLSNVKKTFQEKEENLPTIEIEKDSIASINIIDIRPPKEDIHNFNEIPKNKKNVVDENKLAKEKAYDKSKDDFFDHLRFMTKPEVKKESNKYNRKNKDTFNLSENDNYNNNNKRGWKNRGNRRGYRGRGSYGRGNRGGYNNNSFKNYQNRNNYDGNYNDEKQNYHNQNYFRGRGNRGRGRGRGNRGGFKKSQNNQYNNNGENNLNNNNNNQNESNKVDNQE